MDWDNIIVKFQVTEEKKKEDANIFREEKWDLPEGSKSEYYQDSSQQQYKLENNGKCLHNVEKKRLQPKSN